jgi:hypothetical protein
MDWSFLMLDEQVSKRRRNTQDHDRTIGLEIQKSKIQFPFSHTPSTRDFYSISTGTYVLPVVRTD